MCPASTSDTPPPPTQCPQCGGHHIATILRGMVEMDATLKQQLADGGIVLGGCIIWGDMPNRHCNGCGHEWSVKWVGPDD